MVSEKDQEARKAIMSLLCEGLVTVPEAAKLAGVSRQVVRHWARYIRWADIRLHRISKEYRKAKRRGSKEIPNVAKRVLPGV